MDQTEVKTQEQETGQTEEQTFTQAELNAIVQRRVAETVAKYENYEELKVKAQKFDQYSEGHKTELQEATERADALQKELDQLRTANQERELRERIASEMDVPASLLRGSSEEDLKAQAEAILNYAKSKVPTYPNVKDGGEVAPPTISKAEILAIPDEKKRLAAIKEHIALFE